MDNKLAPRILIALVVGLFVGGIIQMFAAPDGFLQTVLITNTFGTGGTLFVDMIKLVVMPLIFISIVNAVCSLEDISQFGRLGVFTFGLYLVNTAIAIVAAIFVATLLQPGLGADLGLADPSVELSLKEPPSLLAMIVDIVPVNPVDAFVEGKILQILFMAITTGVAIKKLDIQDTHRVSKAFAIANNVMMKLVSMIMSLAPWGVFFLTAKMAATLDIESILSVMSYVGTALLVITVWLFVFYPLMVFATTRRSPLDFIRKTREQMIFALSTASSNATIPVTLRTLTDKLKVSSRIAGFTVPLGATMNMSGAAIYMVVASIFIADAYGLTLNRLELIDLGFTVLLLAIAAGGIPGGAIVTIGVLLHTLGLPVEALGIIIAVDRIIDPVCTVLNVTGDTVVCTIVSHRSTL
ncbi:dicarboxylate/amino acid:cation symporter [Endozoicomonas euniceicola]|uniref:Dicarboxylate/amino acid:cation symporter n=1 Tax=Endozoicomonas euniceicola TaxID=1234143 RepID=A0ABY6GYH2_9GAMM|nr:dicarboxylate/amino acid:cation symporter [Endozoicomonas euniceicola]UYM17627.1 dicarboxylate/amino acid:cation symporter [Endozoicomonas euniceicola]